MVFVVSFTSTILIPAIPNIVKDFQSNDPYLSTFIVSAYLVGYFLGPFLMAPLSDHYGRIPIYHICNLLFVGMTCWCATTHSLGTLATARFLAGCGGSGAVALAPYSVMDMFRSERDFMFMVPGIAFVIAPALGPMAGAHVSAKWGWRCVFWGAALVGAFSTIVALLGLRESHGLVILGRKIVKRRMVTRNLPLRSRLEVRSKMPPSRRFVQLQIRPFLVLRSLSVFFATCVAAVGSGFMYMVFITLTEVFTSEFHWKPENIGYAFTGIAVGNLVGILLGSLLSNMVVKGRKKRGYEKPEIRLLPMILFWPLVGLGLIVYAWTSAKAGAWIWPLVGSGIFGAGVTSANFFSLSYITASYPEHAASGIGTHILVHSIIAGALPVFSNKLYYRMGVGWGFTILGLVALAICPVLYFCYRFGERMRKRLDRSSEPTA
ncbi:MFS general substrate transporter [Massarina eburnea CBS 473.64]|uniref:MFS general substrate transporter n=1 Tax=Massarina eburnea CBS 473.64 TaxID=1395130 RepID=A0A6A6SBH8_9PLEO|nr:MFS general substrate transporter [Massarina eburnea CBS 473.64]